MVGLGWVGILLGGLVYWVGGYSSWGVFGRVDIRWVCIGLAGIGCLGIDWAGIRWIFGCVLSGWVFGVCACVC